MAQSCSLPVGPVHFSFSAKLDTGSLSPASTKSPASTAKSPRTPNYVVKNTFIEVQEHDEAFEIEEELSKSPLQRRRGSSFWRCASEPPIAPRPPREENTTVFQRASDANLLVSAPVTCMTTPQVVNDFPHGPPGSFRTVKDESDLATATHTLPMRNAPTPSRGCQLNAAQLGMLLGGAPSRPTQKNISSGASDTSTTVSTTVGSATSHLEPRASSPGAAAPQPAACHVVWCDHRAFKDTSTGLKSQLEAEVQLPVKAHKSAENVIRLLRKKQRAQGRPPCVFVVSWANAGALLPFLNEFQHVSAKVVVLCDSRGGRRQDGSDDMFKQYPFVEKVAGSWNEAVHAAGKAVAEFQVAHW